MVFSIHLCSKEALLLDYWSTPIVSIFCFSCLDWIRTFIMINCCSNYSIPNIVSINLANALDLAHCFYWIVFPSVWKQIYYFPGGGIFNKFGVAVLVFVSFTEVELWFFFWGVSNDWESELYLTSVLTLFIVLWYKTYKMIKHVNPQRHHNH